MDAKKSPSYDEVKARHLEGGIGTLIHGVPLEVQKQKVIAGRQFEPIIGCYCVQDSLENPCPCVDIIIWLPAHQIIKSAETGRKHLQGDMIRSFLVSNDAEVLVEDRPRSCNVRDLKQTLAVRTELAGLFAGGVFRPGVARRPNRAVVQLIKTAVIAAIDGLAENLSNGSTRPGPPNVG